MQPRTQRTLILIKPDAVRRALDDEIIHRFVRKGLTIVQKRTLTISDEQVKAHYAHHAAKEFFGELVAFMQSAPSHALIIEGPEVIAVTRRLIGATDPLNADPGTIRGDYGTAPMRENLVHGSDSVESAEREIAIYFPDEA